MWGYAKSSQNRLVASHLCWRWPWSSLRVLPPMNAPAQSAAATPTPAAAAAVVPTPTPEPDNGLPKVNTGSWVLTLVNAQNSNRRGRAGGSGRARERPVF